ncbi:MAG: hypothetical protein ACLTE1_09030 [Clostridium sp.]
MAYSKKRLIAAAMAGVLAMMSAFPGYAASRKKITSVSVSIKADIEPETDFGQEIIEIESSSNRYSVDGYEILNEGFYWTEDMTPEIRITLTADDDYYFTALTKDKVTLKGGAEFKKSTRQQSSSVLLLDVTLSSLQNSLKDMEGITLSDNGIATWPAISTAGSYEVRVYREGKIVGTSLETNTNSANYRERMMKPNETYMVKVRAVNKYDPTVKGDWTESNSVYISGEKVAQFKADPNASNVNTASGTTGEWKQEADGRWWYRRADGTYPANKWEELGGKWYFFDENGYMKTGWIDWEGKSYYCSENGDMLTNCMTPDNYLVGEDGAWIAQ